MKRKNVISKLLLVIALLFTVVFQFAHSISHFSADITPISLEKPVQLVSQKDNHGNHISTADHSTEKCFACDFFLSPFLQAETTVFQVWENDGIPQVKTAVVVAIHQYTTIYFSLRAPPVLI